MNKATFLVCTLLFVLASLCACGNDNDDSGTDSDADSDSDTDSDTDSDSDSDLDSDSDSDSDNDTDSDSDTGTGIDTDTIIDTDSTYELDSDSSEVNKIGLSIGISDYNGTGSDLSWVHRDACLWHEYLTERGYEIKILGDGNPEKYPIYHGDATKGNIHNYIKNLLASADANDMVTLTFAGHGSGNGIGSSYYLTLEMSSYSDSDLAVALAENENVGQLFVFIGACYSGGFGPEIMDAGNGPRTYCTTTATENGVGYESSASQLVAWTAYFLLGGMIMEYEGANVAMEEIFDYALAEYPYDDPPYYEIGNTPMEFDGNTGQQFFLDLDSKTGTMPLPELGPQFVNTNPTLREILGNWNKVSVKKMDWSLDATNRTVGTWDIQDQTVPGKLYEALSPDQRVQDKASTCLFSYIIDYAGSDGNTIATVGICDTPKIEKNHPGVVMRFDDNGTMTIRQGIIINNAASIVKMINLDERN